jgi:hypothetical protein
MKKNFLLVAISFFVFQLAKAQTEKGSQTIGLDLGYSYHNSNETQINTFDNTTSVARTKINYFSLGPNYSYFIANNLDLGASVQYSNNTENDYPINGAFGEKETTNSFGGTIYLRKYCMYSNKIGIRTGPYIGYTTADQKSTATGSNADPANNLDTKTTNFNAGVNLALVYFPSKRLGFSATLADLDYNHFKNNDKPTGDHESGDNLSFNFINNGLSISVFLVFGGK